MTIILMTQVVSGPNQVHTHHTGFTALGHEIHLGRLILLDMLHNNYIDENDVIVTCEDRFLLYKKIFKHVITPNQYLKNDFINTNDVIVLQIWPFVVSKASELNDYYIKDFESKINYPIRQKLYERFERNFDVLISKIDFPIIPDTFLPNKKFVIIHLRSLTTLKNNNNFDINYVILLRIVSKIKNKYPHLDIYVFCSQNITLDIPNIKVINKLDIYAALMHHDYCKAVISELSGGGEFAQYCHNNKIYLYGNSYANLPTNVIDNISLIQNEQLIHTNWNMHGITNASLRWYLSVNELLEDLHI